MERWLWKSIHHQLFDRQDELLYSTIEDLVQMAVIATNELAATHVVCCTSRSGKAAMRLLLLGRRYRPRPRPRFLLWSSTLLSVLCSLFAPPSWAFDTSIDGHIDALMWYHAALESTAFYDGCTSWPYRAVPTNRGNGDNCTVRWRWTLLIFHTPMTCAG